MDYYFVDYENTQSGGLDGIENLTRKDCVYLFYSVNADKIPIDVLNSTKKSGAKLIPIKANTGINALDFQLSSELGFAVSRCKPKRDSFYIVSNDRGFECLTEYWSRKNARVYCVANIAKKSKPAPNAPKPYTPKPYSPKPYKPLPSVQSTVPKLADCKYCYDEVRLYVNNSEDAKTAVTALNDAKEKSDVFISLSRAYKSTEKASEVYGQLRPLMN